MTHRFWFGRVNVPRPSTTHAHRRAQARCHYVSAIITRRDPSCSTQQQSQKPTGYALNCANTRCASTSASGAIGSPCLRVCHWTAAGSHLLGRQRLKGRSRRRGGFLSSPSTSILQRRRWWLPRCSCSLPSWPWPDTSASPRPRLLRAPTPRLPARISRPPLARRTCSTLVCFLRWFSGFGALKSAHPDSTQYLSDIHHNFGSSSELATCSVDPGTNADVAAVVRPSLQSA